MVKKWPKLALNWPELVLKWPKQLAKTMARKNNQSFQSMMLYNGAKKTLLLINIVY